MGAKQFLHESPYGTNAYAVSTSDPIAFVAKGLVVRRREMRPGLGPF